MNVLKQCLAAVTVLATLVITVPPTRAQASLGAAQARTLETGGDLSEVTWEQSTGVTFKDANGAAIDPVAYAKSQGWTTCRLRLLVNPNGQAGIAQSLPYDLALAKRIKAARMKLILDIFYSDTWADPGKQPTPAAWQGQDYAQLKATVLSYTQSVLTSFKGNETVPDYVQVGNEISNGMLWPVGSLKNQSQFIGLIQAGIAGVRAASPTSKIILHCNNAAVQSLVTWFYTTIASQCDYDIVGLSYYPDNGTDLSDIASALNAYDGKFGNRPIMLVEFGYKYAFGAAGPGYPNTPLGQAQCTTALVGIVMKHPQDIGVIYWGATYVTGNWGAESLFDYTTNQAGPAFSALR